MPRNYGCEDLAVKSGDSLEPRTAMSDAIRAAGPSHRSNALYRQMERHSDGASVAPGEADGRASHLPDVAGSALEVLLHSSPAVAEKIQAALMPGTPHGGAFAVARHHLDDMGRAPQAGDDLALLKASALAQAMVRSTDDATTLRLASRLVGLLAQFDEAASWRPVLEDVGPGAMASVLDTIEIHQAELTRRDPDTARVLRVGRAVLAG